MLQNLIKYGFHLKSVIKQSDEADSTKELNFSFIHGSILDISIYKGKFTIFSHLCSNDFIDIWNSDHFSDIGSTIIHS